PQQQRTEPSAHRPCRRGVKSSLRREPNVPGDLLRALFDNVTRPSGLPVPPFDYKNLKRLFGGLVIANNGFNKRRAEEAIADGRADLIAFGKSFIANPDLVIRLFLDAPLAPVNRETLYGGSVQGYTDYPILGAATPHACYHD